MPVLCHLSCTARYVVYFMCYVCYVAYSVTEMPDKSRYFIILIQIPIYIICTGQVQMPQYNITR